MEYNLIADILAKFAACSCLIKSLIVVGIVIVFVRASYYIKQTITESVKSIKANKNESV